MKTASLADRKPAVLLPGEKGPRAGSSRRAVKVSAVTFFVELFNLNVGHTPGRRKPKPKESRARMYKTHPARPGRPYVVLHMSNNHQGVVVVFPPNVCYRRVVELKLALVKAVEGKLPKMLFQIRNKDFFKVILPPRRGGFGKLNHLCQSLFAHLSSGSDLLVISCQVVCLNCSLSGILTISKSTLRL